MLQLSPMQMFTVAWQRKEETNNAVIEAYRMSHDFAAIWSVVEHCVSQVSVFTFFFFSPSSCFFRGGFYWGGGNAFIQR